MLISDLWSVCKWPPVAEVISSGHSFLEVTLLRFAGTRPVSLESNAHFSQHVTGTILLPIYFVLFSIFLYQEFFPLLPILILYLKTCLQSVKPEISASALSTQVCGTNGLICSKRGIKLLGCTRPKGVAGVQGRIQERVPWWGGAAETVEGKQTEMCF